MIMSNKTNKWREFAQLNNMTNEQFAIEVIECTQAVLAIRLAEMGSEELIITNAQNDGVYRLKFERIVK